MQNNKIKQCRGQVLDWYDSHKRDLPWRDVNDPYKTWMSEIMLQQTTVTAVAPYYHKFLDKWPTIHDLANATQDEVMHEWAGLGYYSRARNLHKCANAVVNDHNGEFPQDQTSLKKLPGIGDYTSAAIRTIAFNKPATVMDGNIERIIARLFQIKDPLPKSKPIYKEKTALFFENYAERPGDFAQSLMDIGASICTPKNPKCMLCPLNNHCAAHRAGDMETYPIKAKKKARPSKTGYVYWIEKDGNILLERRPETGLLAGTLGFPTSDWNTKKPAHTIKNAQETGHSIRHVFTHFDLELKLCTATIDAEQDNHQWHAIDSHACTGLPSLFSKVYKQFTNIV